PPGGSGLGLPLARRLARSCGGDVLAGEGPGGCFVLELPALGARGSQSGSGQAALSILPRCSPRSPRR
ncbi:MAG TPA: hypothetical protein VHB30_08450, partial [Solirubrobacteraceae bacterium]|nr:hypothetical protein [Solirubrobacteraceae bacterium]